MEFKGLVSHVKLFSKKKKGLFLFISHSELNKTCLLSRFTSISFTETVLLHWFDINTNSITHKHLINLFTSKHNVLCLRG